MLENFHNNSGDPEYARKDIRDGLNEYEESKQKPKQETHPATIPGPDKIRTEIVLGDYGFPGAHGSGDFRKIDQDELGLLIRDLSTDKGLIKNAEARDELRAANEALAFCERGFSVEMCKVNDDPFYYFSVQAYLPDEYPSGRTKEDRKAIINDLKNSL